MAETLLTVEHLIKKYGDQVILEDVSLDVKKGEVIVVVGPSGCGKSTLLRCINALEPIQGGVVKLGSEVIDPKSKSLTCLRQKIGMVFQSYIKEKKRKSVPDMWLRKKRGTVHEERYFNKGDVCCSHSDYYSFCDVW